MTSQPQEGSGGGAGGGGGGGGLGGYREGGPGEMIDGEVMAYFKVEMSPGFSFAP